MSRRSEDELHKQVVDSLTEATPEWWDYARLDLTVTSEEDTEGYAHSIFNPGFPRDYVEPTDELYAATHELALHFKAAGKMWKDVYCPG